MVVRVAGACSSCPGPDPSIGSAAPAAWTVDLVTVVRCPYGWPVRRIWELRHVIFSAIFGCLLALGLVATAVASIQGATDGWRAHHGGIRGTYTVTECHLHQSRQLTTWDCPGSFVSDDGTIRTQGMLDATGERDNGERVPATIADARAHDVSPISGGIWWAWPVAGLVVALGGSVLFVWAAYTLILGRHRRGPQTRAAPAGHPDLPR